MRRVDIITERDSYLPGEVIHGNVILTCDRSYNTNGVSISLSCSEVTRVVHGSGKHRHVHADQTDWINETYELLPSGTVDYGETRLEFSFRLPADCMGVFQGMYGSIRYELRAKVGVPRALDTKATRPLTVLWAVPELASSAVSARLMMGESEIMVVEVPDDVIVPSASFAARVTVRTETRMRGIRVELVYREFVWPDGNETTYETVLGQVFIPKEEIHFESWQEVIMPLPTDLPIPFRSGLIETSYHLKTTVDIPLAFDKSVYVPVKLGKAGDLQRETDEIFGTGDLMFRRSQ